MYGNNYQQGNGFQQNGYQQQPQQAQPVSMSLDSVMQGGTPSAFSKDDQIGASVSGEITSIEAQQQTDFTTGAPLFYPNGNPKPQVVIHLKTSQHDPNREYDDGMRAVYVKGYNLKALKQASQQAGVGDYPRVGDQLTATFSSTQPAKQRGYNDAKLYTYVVVPGNPNKAGLDAAMNDPYAGAQQPVQPMPQQATGYAQAPAQFTPQQPAAPSASNPQQTQQILQLKALGKTPQEIAGMMGIDVQQVLAAAGTQTVGSESEPEF